MSRRCAQVIERRTWDGGEWVTHMSRCRRRLPSTADPGLARRPVYCWQHQPAPAGWGFAAPFPVAKYAIERTEEDR